MMKKQLPDFFIIGAMKCATSTLHEQLAQYPTFFMSTPKEPNFFSDDKKYMEGIEWYYSLFTEALPGQLVGESSTHYTKLPTYPNTIDRIKKVKKTAKFIYVIRHPIDRLISHYIHEWTENKISCDINEAIYRHQELIEYGKYHKQIIPYIEEFGKENILLIFFEDIKSYPEKVVNMIFKFLDIDEIPIWDHDLKSNVSAERLRKSPLRDTILSMSVAKYLRRNFVPKSIRDSVKKIWMIDKRPILNEESIAHLSAIYDKDLSSLGHLMGISLTTGEYKEIVANLEQYKWV